MEVTRVEDSSPGFRGEALSALAEKRNGVAELLMAAQHGDHRVFIPTVVIAEVATGSATDAAIWRVLGAIPTIALPPDVAMRAGAMRSRAARTRRKKRVHTVDSIVAATAVGLEPSAVVTADPFDMRVLVEGFDSVVTAI